MTGGAIDGDERAVVGITLGNQVKGLGRPRHAAGSAHGRTQLQRRPGIRCKSPTIPYLAGQYAHYTATQLQMWQSGFRRNSPTTMTLFANLLNDREIAALAAYYQQVGLPAPSVANKTSDHDARR
jgi:cytochrome c553